MSKNNNEKPDKGFFVSAAGTEEISNGIGEHEFVKSNYNSSGKLPTA